MTSLPRTPPQVGDVCHFSANGARIVSGSWDESCACAMQPRARANADARRPHLCVMTNKTTLNKKNKATHIFSWACDAVPTWNETSCSSFEYHIEASKQRHDPRFQRTLSLSPPAGTHVVIARSAHWFMPSPTSSAVSPEAPPSPRLWPAACLSGCPHRPAAAKTMGAISCWPR